MKRFFTLLLLAAVTSGYSAAAQDKTSEAELRRQIGQMIVAGFRGYEAGPDSEIARAVRDLQIGGVIYFDRDVPTGTNRRNIQSPVQLKALSAQLQSYAKTPLLITIDQEGGQVSRLKEQYGFSRTVSAAFQGRQNDPGETFAWATGTAETLAEAGINVNFAPCVDVNVNPKCPVIGARGRSFSSDPETVIRHAEMWVAAHYKKEVVTALKHFPGHGSSRTDSHLGLTDITDTWQREIELQPYEHFIGLGHQMQGMIMVGHLVHRRIDPDYPASLSRIWITDILRGQLGYDGLVVTDDMNMGAIVDHYSLERALELSINAGVDLIILGNNGPKFEPDLTQRAIELIYGLVQAGKISPERIEEANGRITAIKQNLNP